VEADFSKFEEEFEEFEEEDLEKTKMVRV